MVFVSSQTIKKAFLQHVEAVKKARLEKQGEQESESSPIREWTDEEIQMAIGMGW